MSRYNVLKPEFAKTGEFTPPTEYHPKGQPIFRVKAWKVIGSAKNMADAKRQGFIAPVLEEAKAA